MSRDERALRRILMGLGFDKAPDDLLRITRGDHFFLIGGSKPTHENMQEICLKFGEEARRRVKTLDELTNDEILEIADRLGLKPGGRGRNTG